MIEHLSAEQISQWMVGERAPEVERHLADCTACRAELEQLESALSHFRTAMREPADSVAPTAWREPASQTPWHSWPSLLLAVAALLVLVAVPLSWQARERQLAAESAQAALADSQLLESVDSAISKAVPEPMEPLVSMVSWNANSSDQNQKAQPQ
jgi:anti-sigma factor RsiW